MPATLHSTSIVPHLSTTCFTAAMTSSSFATLHLMSILLSCACCGGSRMSKAATLAPCSSNRAAVEAPMPLLAPVIITTCCCLSVSFHIPNCTCPLPCPGTVTMKTWLMVRASLSQYQKCEYQYPICECHIRESRRDEALLLCSAVVEVLSLASCGLRFLRGPCGTSQSCYSKRWTPYY